jgi:multidrug efflux pump subunit AcrA (membrane-fusion protein)
MRMLIEFYLAGLAVVVLVATGCGQDSVTAPAEKPRTILTADTKLPRADTVKAASRSFTLYIDLPGASVHGFESTLLEAKIGGYVKTLGQFKDAAGTTEDVDIGTRVEKGDILAVLDTPEMFDELKEKEALVSHAESDVAQYAAAISQAEAQMVSAAASSDEAKTERLEKEALRKFAQAEFDNQQKLYSTQATTRELLVKAQSQLDAATAGLASADARIRTAAAFSQAAEANVRKAEADHQSAIARVKVANATLARINTLLEYANIRAPFAGVVTKRTVDHGTFVRSATSNSAAMPLFEVTRNDKVRLIAKVPMIRAERVKLGQPVIFHSIGGLPGVTVEGRVSRSAKVLDHNSRMLEIQVDLTNPVKHAGWVKRDRKWVEQKATVSRDVVLKPGMVGTATILESWENVAVVPTTAVGVNEGGNSYVLVVENTGGKNYCRQRVVDVAFNDASEVGISAGISPGDAVIAKNIDKLSDGQQVAEVDGI